MGATGVEYASGDIRILEPGDTLPAPDQPFDAATHGRGRAGMP